MQGTLSEPEIEDVLATEIFGHLGCSDSGKPYVFPMAYLYRRDVIYGQTTEGKKVEIMRKNPLICFQVERLKDDQWRSVICWGTFEELEFAKLKPDAIEAVKLLTELIGTIQEDVGITIPYSFKETALPLTVNEKRSTLFRIVVSEKSGKFYATQK